MDLYKWNEKHKTKYMDKNLKGHFKDGQSKQMNKQISMATITTKTNLFFIILSYILYYVK